MRAVAENAVRVSVQMQMPRVVCACVITGKERGGLTSGDRRGYIRMRCSRALDRSHGEREQMVE